MNEEEIINQLFSKGWVGNWDMKSISKKISKDRKFLIDFNKDHLEIKYIDYDLTYGVIASLKLMYHNFKVTKIDNFTEMSLRVGY